MFAFVIFFLWMMIGLGSPFVINSGTSSLEMDAVALPKVQGQIPAELFSVDEDLISSIGTNISGNSSFIDIGEEDLWIHIVSPINGAAMEGTEVQVVFQMRGPAASQISWLKAYASESWTHLNTSVRDLLLQNVEPGTHMIEVIAAAAGPRGGMIETRACVTWDTIMDPDTLRKHRFHPTKEEINSVTSLDRSSMPPWTSCSLLSIGSNGHVQRASFPSSPPTPPAQKKSLLCFVSSLKLDGQRIIYLEQFDRLPRDRYDVVVLNMAKDQGDGEVSVFQQRIAALGVPLVVAPPLSVSIREAKEALGDQQVTEEAVIKFVMERFDAANKTLVNDDLLQPRWVREIFHKMIKTIKGIAPDIMIFANGREVNDRLLTESARLAGVSRIVMELPNLYPHIPLDTDALVAPSYYAAHHPSVQALVVSEKKQQQQQGGGKKAELQALVDSGKQQQGGGGEKGENSSSSTAASSSLPWFVITPGVDANRFHPRRTVSFFDGSIYKEDQKEEGCHALCRTSNGSSCDPECFVNGFVGRLDHEKSPGLFIKMAALVYQHYPKARFLVIGYGRLRDVLESEARRLGLEANVLHFTGVVHQALPSLLRQMDVLVNPSLRAWSETFCIVNVEAMASGLPIISFGVGGTGEYLRDGYNSLIVERAEPEALAEGVLRLIREPDLRARLGLQARSTVLERFTVERQIDMYDRLYQQLLN